MSQQHNLSIRGARREFSSRFEHAINSFRVMSEFNRLNVSANDLSLLSRLPPEMARRIIRSYIGPTVSGDLLAMAQPLRPPPAEQFEIFCRKRPLWNSEAEDGEYDALTIDDKTGQCVVHDGKAGRDMSTYTLHREFALDGVYGASADERQMLSRVVDPLCELAHGGGAASLILFGQTGTGKTHTSHNMQCYLARRLLPPESEAGAHWAFPAASAATSSATSTTSTAGTTSTSVVLEIFELREKKAYDLLNGRKAVRLVADSDERIHVLGGTKVVATTAEELLSAISRAHKLRSVAATERNAQSSRSHCVCRLRVVTETLPADAGSLTLVDLAGSERNYETTQHDRQATRESADINMSLQTLKECFRATINHDIELETFVEVDQDDVEWTRAVPKGYKAALAEAKRAAEEAKAAGADGESTYNGLAFDPAKPAALMNFAMAKEASNAKSLHMPYRRHQLTLLLKDCFTNPQHRWASRAALSPALNPPHSHSHDSEGALCCCHCQCCTGSFAPTVSALLAPPPGRP